MECSSSRSPTLHSGATPRALWAAACGALLISLGVLSLVRAGVVDAETVGPLGCERRRHGVSIILTAPGGHVGVVPLAALAVAHASAWWALLAAAGGGDGRGGGGGPRKRRQCAALGLSVAAATASTLGLLSGGERGAHSGGASVLLPGSGAWCHGVQAGSIVSLLRARAVVFGEGLCAQAARLHGAVDRYDLARRSGGEVLFCENAMALASAAGFAVVATPDAGRLGRLVLAMERAGAPPLVAMDGSVAGLPGFNASSGTESTRGLARVPPPLREQCYLQMGFWGPHTAWPGSPRNFVTPYPHPSGGGAHVGVRADLCERTRGRRPELSPEDESLLSEGGGYALLYGKFSATANPEAAPAWFRGPGLWADVLARVGRVVVSDCTPGLARALGVELSSFTCLHRASPLRGANLADLIERAHVVLGVGSPHLSPTPLEALACNTSVVLPRGQHPFLEENAGPPAFQAVGGASELLRAIDAAMALGGRGERGEAVAAAARGALRLVDPRSDELRRDFAGTLEAAHAACSNATGFSVGGARLQPAGCGELLGGGWGGGGAAGELGSLPVFALVAASWGVSRTRLWPGMWKTELWRTESN